MCDRDTVVLIIFWRFDSPAVVISRASVTKHYNLVGLLAKWRRNFAYDTRLQVAIVGPISYNSYENGLQECREMS